jgi:hypothetical protein
MPVFNPLDQRQTSTSVESDELLANLLNGWHALLQAWAKDGALERAIYKALQLERRNNWLAQVLSLLAQGDTSELPSIQLLDSSEIREAAGAYSDRSGTIYLNRQWLQQASIEQALTVLNEELGHHWDALLNSSDTAGDEGKYFAALLNGTTLSANDFSLDAKGEIIINGQTLAAEFSILDTSYGNMTYMVAEKFVVGTTSANSIFNARSVYYQGSSGTSDILATSWDSTLASSLVTPSGLTAWQVYTSSSKTDFFTVFAPFIETINFNGTPVNQSSSPASTQRISYSDGHQIADSYAGFRTGADDDLVFGRILDTDKTYKSSNESYVLASNQGTDSLFIPLRKGTSHVAYEALDALGISRLRFSGTDADEISYITSGVENFDYLDFRFKPSGTREYNLINGNPALNGVGQVRSTASNSLPYELLPESTSRTTSGTTGDDFFFGISQNNTSFYDSYDGRTGQDILYLPAFISSQLSITAPSATSHQLFFSGSGVTITANNIEFVLFRDRAVKLIPGVLGLEYYSWTPDLGPKSYTITAPSTVNEGSSYAATLSTSGIADQTIYWKILNSSTNSSDFSLSQGSTSLSAGLASVSIPITADAQTEGIEPATLQFFLDGTYSSPVASKTFSINDTSQTPVTYAITAPSTVDEGSSFIATLNTTGIFDRTVHWKVVGTTASTNDFDLVEGSSLLSSGRTSATIPVTADFLSEGLETAEIRYYLNSNYISPVATQLFDINDTSITTPITSTIDAPKAINEGASLTASLTTTGLANRTIYWKIAGDTTDSRDFSQIQGSTPLASGRANISTLVSADSLTEGSESATLQFFLDSSYTTAVASKTFSINDTSTTPITYSISAASSIDESNSLVATLTTTGITDRIVYWRVINGSTTSEDFEASQGSTSLIAGKTEMSILAKADLLTEGSETAAIEFYLDSNYTSPVASKGFTIGDASTTPITYRISSPSSVSEGAAFFAKVNTTGVADRTIYWKIKEGTAESDDFILIQGTTFLSTGETEVSVSVEADRRTEGIELATLEFYLDSDYSTLVAANIFSISDNSKTPISYSVSAPSTVDEGAEITATLDTAGVEDQKIYWDITGSVGIFDLSESGSADLVNGKANVSVPIFADSATEGPEVATINFYMDSSRSIPVASRSFSIRDTSLSPSVPTSGTDSNRGQTITAGTGKNNLVGGNGPDKLTGGASQDRKTGNSGADTFILLEASDSQPGSTRRDLITDFDRLQGDRIDLSQIDADSSKGGNQKFRFIGGRSFPGSPGDLRYAGGILAGDINGDKKSDFEIQLLGNPSLSRREIIM